MWLASERSLIDRDEWSPPEYRKAAAASREREQARSTVGSFAEQYVVERGLRPATMRGYRTLLESRILPTSAQCRCGTSRCRRSIL
ncbi:hypothetical protein GUY44_09300 [Pimelobacter simplex]|uniref:hypothetical protein n=1 Tax=Nocardioides simplex TaxID=2045 RepID=UPI001143AAC6|nr:hypothetical protein [Pimelobacter simplex]MCG8150674.1 hypothetical protein [Pimelobacter simplex]